MRTKYTFPNCAESLSYSLLPKDSLCREYYFPTILECFAPLFALGDRRSQVEPMLGLRASDPLDSFRRLCASA